MSMHSPMPPQINDTCEGSCGKADLLTQHRGMWLCDDCRRAAKPLGTCECLNPATTTRYGVPLCARCAWITDGGEEQPCPETSVDRHLGCTLPLGHLGDCHLG